MTDRRGGVFSHESPFSVYSLTWSVREVEPSMNGCLRNYILLLYVDETR
jgi:hypothetical protein